MQKDKERAPCQEGTGMRTIQKLSFLTVSLWQLTYAAMAFCHVFFGSILPTRVWPTLFGRGS
jgi:hypothetical protein